VDCVCLKADVPVPMPCTLSCTLSCRAGADHTAGVTAGGTLLTWGNGQQGQLGRVGERLSDRVKMETLLTPHAVPFRRIRCGRTGVAVMGRCIDCWRP
jgi:alpha-tubulin suppressor-like RCC1 family protein